jgi:hypothetical protein
VRGEVGAVIGGARSYNYSYHNYGTYCIARHRVVAVIKMMFTRNLQRAVTATVVTLGSRHCCNYISMELHVSRIVRGWVGEWLSLKVSGRSTYTCDWACVGCVG